MSKEGSASAFKRVWSRECFIEVYINNRCKIVIIYLSHCLGWQTERLSCNVCTNWNVFMSLNLRNGSRLMSNTISRYHKLRRTYFIVQINYNKKVLYDWVLDACKNVWYWTWSIFLVFNNTKWQEMQWWLKLQCLKKFA